MALERIITESPSNHITSIYDRESSDARVMIVDGYGIRLQVRYGQLEITDGIGRCRREREIIRADRNLRKIVIAGIGGYLTIEALRWCRNHGISVTVIDKDGEIVGIHYPPPSHSVSLLRIQALSGIGAPLEAKGLEVSRFLLERKLSCPFTGVRDLASGDGGQWR
jgi:CRISPR/Cas system-associated endonuclease Cas1